MALDWSRDVVRCPHFCGGARNGVACFACCVIIIGAPSSFIAGYKAIHHDVSLGQRWMIVTAARKLISLTAWLSFLLFASLVE
jgi:hypothetical protein